ncbi:MAG TPA: hypothetical protein VE129_00490 [Thermoanaerobaculia bacterium]|nr:hypothetical protein [Thermoanaerobaculia bacterium]
MEWNAVVHPRLSVPVLPPTEQVVLVYVASLRQFAVGQHRGGAWTVQPPLAGAVTHWAVLTPPGAPAPATATAPVKRDLVQARPVVVPKPPYNR